MVRGFLIDLDGVLYHAGEAVPGAADAVNGLRHEGCAFRFVTNTTMRSRGALVEKLRSMGIEAEPSEMFSTCVVCRPYKNRDSSRFSFAIMAR